MTTEEIDEFPFDDDDLFHAMLDNEIDNQPVPTGNDGFNYNNINTNGDQGFDVAVPQDGRWALVTLELAAGTPPPLLWKQHRCHAYIPRIISVRDHPLS